MPAGKLLHTVAFRVDDQGLTRLHALRATFPGNQWSECFRWLLDDPVVADRIKARIRAAGGETQ